MSNNHQVVVAGPRNGITAEKIEQEIKKSPLTVLKSEGKSYKGKKNIVIEGFDFRIDKDGNKQCAVTDCENVTIRRCIFGNKHTLGQGLNITGDKTKKVTVEYCIFENMTYTESNGGEPCRIGNSQFSGISFECIVRNCIFRNLKSDPETISIKSCRNIIEDNFFFNNKSNVTVRHGGLTTIRHNYFKGSGGIRLHGYGNKVSYNCFDGNKDTGSFSPIIVRYGNSNKDPNFTDAKTPSEKEGNSHAIYARTVDNVIECNEFKDCTKTIVELEKGASLKPVNTKVGENPTVKEFKFMNNAPLPPPEVQPEPEQEPKPEPEQEPEKPPVVVDPEEGEEEEEEQPVIKPSPDDATDTHMCGIFRHEEAKVHLHVYACGEHAPILIEKFKQALRETEEEFRKQQQEEGVTEGEEKERGVLEKIADKAEDLIK